jgi:ribonucleoside-diphosphate reductase alpha chain
MASAPTASISILCGGTSPGIEPTAANAYTHKTLSGSFAVKNPYLEKLLEEKGQNNDDVWSSIFTNEGSVQHLDFLSQDEKDVFKTAFEIDQRWLIEHAADRAPYICQAQSLNLFLPANVHKRDLHRLHMEAWKKGVKSLYYCRSKSIQRAESAASWARSKEGAPKIADNREPELAASGGEANKYEECLACQ